MFVILPEKICSNFYIYSFSGSARKAVNLKANNGIKIMGMP